jgi:hypothetical protein
VTEEHYTLEDNPWHDYLPLITALMRSLLIAAGGAGLTWAKNVTGSDIELWASIVCLVTGASWSFWQKIQAKRALRRAARNPAGAPTPALPA